METDKIGSSIRKEAAIVLWRVLLFIVYYIALIVLGIGLFFGALGVTILLLQFLVSLNRISVRALAVIIILWLAMWWFCIQFAWYLVKPLFSFHSSSDMGRMEIKRRDCPELFAMIADVAKATGNRMPKHVYLTADVNACVFYNTTSIWTIFLPARMNLMIGMGLMQGMNKDEIKAILGHEYGHFSQHTMRVGRISYRLLLIIQGMIELAYTQQKSAAISQAKGENGYFHLVSKPISFITRLTIKFYGYIERRNRRLSRYMEFEADSVACRIVGAKPFISSLCKLNIISERNSTYENIVTNLISNWQYINNYWAGYEIVCSLLQDEGQVRFTNEDIIDSMIYNKTHLISRIKRLDGWDTHPSTEDRIEKARQYIESDKKIDTTCALTMIPEKIMNDIGTIKLKLIAENMFMSPDFTSVDEISLEEFKKKVEDEFRSRPVFLQPFLDKMIIGFTLPKESEITEPIENPFSETNRNYLLEFKQGVDDLQKLNQIKSEDSASKHLIYNGENMDCATAIVQQLKYLSNLTESLKVLDINVYKYLLKKAKDISVLENTYRALFLGDSGQRGMRSIADTVRIIRDQLGFMRTHGHGGQLKREVMAQLTKDFCYFLQSYDYRLTLKLAGRSDADCQQVDDWLVFALEGNPDNLFKMVDYIWSVINDLYNTSKSRLDQIMVDAYYDKVNI